jgi:hypothetical protein
MGLTAVLVVAGVGLIWFAHASALSPDGDGAATDLQEPMAGGLTAPLNTI